MAPKVRRVNEDSERESSGGACCPLPCHLADLGHSKAASFYRTFYRPERLSEHLSAPETTEPCAPGLTRPLPAYLQNRGLQVRVLPPLIEESPANAGLSLV
jgi:hypothetical protein